jgi:hypothetical protein
MSPEHEKQLRDWSRCHVPGQIEPHRCSHCAIEWPCPPSLAVRALDEAAQARDYSFRLERDLSQVSFAAADFLERSGYGAHKYQATYIGESLETLKDLLCEIQMKDFRGVMDLVRDSRDIHEAEADRG